MSAPDPNAYQNWYKNVVGAAVPWLAGGPNGQAEAASWPAVLDYYVAQLVQARYQRFPDKCSPDALPHIGNDIGIVQGQNESQASFIARCKDPWGQWSRAGQACGVLEQLWYFGLTTAYWVQQNGLYYTFAGQTLTPGQDPTSLLQSGNTASLTSTLTSGVQAVFAPPGTYHTIPSGNPWFAFDLNTDMCNRFAIICSSWPFAALTTAFFNNSDAATVTWPFTFGDTTYNIQIGALVVTDGGGGATLHADSGTKTTSGVTIRASGPITGYAAITAYATGVNPLNTFTTASAGTLQRLITTFRPNSPCMGVKAVQSGRVWGWPATVKWGDGGTWGGSVATILSGVF